MIHITKMIAGISHDIYLPSLIRTGSLPGASRRASAAVIGLRALIGTAKADHGKEFSYPSRSTLGAGHLLVIRLAGVAKESVEPVSAILATVLVYGHLNLLAKQRIS
jgi:hypothetical protein